MADKPAPTKQLGQFSGLELTWSPPAIIGSIFIWVILGSAGFWGVGLSPGQAFLGGLLGVLLHWFGEFFHQLGHSLAARFTGYPMQGINFGNFYLLGQSIYPPEPDNLPRKVHLQRALGGPAASLLLTILAGELALAFSTTGGLLWWLFLFTSLENFFLFFLGAFLPLGFTDGSTIIRLMRQK